MAWGLRGIGADDVVVSGVFVPEYRAFSWLDMKFDSNVVALDRLPQPTLYTLAGTIPVLGVAQRLLAGRTSEPAAALDALAMAATDVELSVLQIRRDIDDLMGCVGAGGFPDADLALRTRRDQVLASERAARAVGLIVADPGPDADEALLERVWRDVQTARMHVASKLEQVLAVAGRHTLGLNVDDLIW